MVSIKTSFARASGATGRPAFLYSPTILGVRLLFFAPLCYTTRMAEKIALITGASSGFGLLTSVEFEPQPKQARRLMFLGSSERLNHRGH